MASYPTDDTSQMHLTMHPIRLYDEYDDYDEYDSYASYDSCEHVSSSGMKSV
jgi:hypothetical protein